MNNGNGLSADQRSFLKVDDAATATDYNSYSWFKIAEQGLDNSSGKWAVDTMIAGTSSGVGWWDFTVPSCGK